MSMKRTLSLFALLVAGCGSADQGPAGIDLDALDREADPCTDFYQYACGGWIKTHPVGSDGSRSAKFYEPFYEAQPRLQEIIENDAAGDRADDDPYAALIGDYYSSCLTAPTDLSSRDKLRALLAEIDGVSTLDDLANQVASQREIGSGSLFSFYVGIDPGDATRHIAALDEGGVELGDRAYYLDPDYADILSLYEAHINAMSALIGGTPIDAAAVIKVETALAAASLPGEERRDPEKLYHPMKAADVAAMAPSFPWQTFWEKAGFSGLSNVNVIVPDYLTALDQLLETTPIEDLKSYVRWQLLQDRSSGLDQAFLDQNFSFWSNFSGQSSLPPRWYSCFNATLGTLGQAVARPYVARYFDEAARETTSAMVERARAAFGERLEADVWLDAPTRKEVLAKLDAVVAKVGYPAKVPDYTELGITAGSYLDNEIAVRLFGNANARKVLDQPVDRTQWNLSPVTVNASYSGTMNDLTLPAALLTSPFLVEGRTDAANFGALGVLIGHEMTHGFDDRGRHFGADGTLADLWTPAAEASFKDRAQCISDQFDGYEALPGEHVNGAFTLGENIADLGGINIAYAALFDGEGDETGGDGFNAKQVFFLSYAQTWCEDVRPDFQSYLLLVDPHSPGRFRVNGPLSNLPEFREAFSCSDSSAMVRSDPCELW